MTRARGFTLLELVVVMGILGGFLVMLVQLVDSGLRLFDEGEAGQRLADQSSTAQRLVARELSPLRGPGIGVEPAFPDARLLVQRLPLGLPARHDASLPVLPVVRAAVFLETDEELALLGPELRARAAELVGEANPAELGAKVLELRRTTPLRGIGQLWLVPWPQDGVASGLLSLRVARFLPGQVVWPERGRSVDPREVVVPGSSDLPAAAVEGFTRELVRDLLWFDVRMWSQHTAGWDAGSAGPESAWDSARAGWLGAQTGGAFALDVGPESLEDLVDDVFPRALRVTLVVAQPEELRPEGFLAEDLGEEETVLRLLDGSRFPGSVTGGWIKVGSEWLRYGERAGDELRPLQRARRDTKAKFHPSGTRVHVGRTVTFTLTPPFGRDAWHG